MQIDILIVICSCFAPTPSLASMVVNHFKMRTDVLSHNLSGMGCSSGVIGIDMARHYLQVITHDPFAPTICPSSDGALQRYGPLRCSVAVMLLLQQTTFI